MSKIRREHKIKINKVGKRQKEPPTDDSTCKECKVITLTSQSQSPFPRPMAHSVTPISVFIALGHVSANAVKATAGGGLVHW